MAGLVGRDGVLLLQNDDRPARVPRVNRPGGVQAHDSRADDREFEPVDHAVNPLTHQAYNLPR